MSNYVITRTYSTDVTLGVMTDAINMEICKTLELPNLGNQPQISCIPEGTYPYTIYPSPHLQRNVLLLHNVPGREDCEIHNGNTVLNIRGCVVVGDKYGTLVVNGKNYSAVLDSVTTLDKLIADAGESGIITFTS